MPAAFFTAGISEFVYRPTECVPVMGPVKRVLDLLVNALFFEMLDKHVIDYRAILVAV